MPPKKTPNVRFEKYQKRQEELVKKEQKRKVIGWDMVKNEAIYED
jgi:urease beta subunit